MNRRYFLKSSLAGAVAACLPYGHLLSATRISSGVAAVTGSGSAITLEPGALQELKDSLRGALLLAGEPGYDQARRVLNESIDRHPALVVQPSGVADIRTAVTFAKERDLLLAVKCGGHSYAGKSTCDRGMQIDLSHFRGVQIDPMSRTARVAGGSLLGELDHEAMAFGLVTTAGTVSHTGVAGLTLGGGFGRIARRHGLALDNVKAVELVTADGKLVRASAAENPDLFWGVRGGGGNFGIVTSFEFALHPMSREVIGGDLVFPMARARELLEFYTEFSLGAPDDLYIDAIMSTPAGGKDGVFLIHVCYTGPADAGRIGARAGAQAGHAARGRDRAGRLRGPAAQQRPDGSAQPRGVSQVGLHQRSRRQAGLHHHGRLRAAPRARHDACSSSTPVALSVASRQMPRRSRIGARPTTCLRPFPGRSARMRRRTSHTSRSTGQRWSLSRTAITRTRSARRRQRFVDANYQGNLARLQAVKSKYDPSNLFRLNANVTPAA